MKRRELIKHLENFGCEFRREGGDHTRYVNWKLKKSTSIPRHNEIKEMLAKKICKDLGIPPPK